MREKILCKGCGTPIRKGRPWHKFCSRDCRLSYHHTREARLLDLLIDLEEGLKREAVGGRVEGEVDVEALEEMHERVLGFLHTTLEDVSEPTAKQSSFLDRISSQGK